jgi:hypothetical protein
METGHQMVRGFNLSTVFATVAHAVPDREVLVWRDRRVTCAEMDVGGRAGWSLYVENSA